MSKRNKIILSAFITMMLLGAVFVFYTFNPEDTLLFPQCPFLLTTGYECPGCGSQRAIHSILHLKLADAFRYNALILFLVPYILLGFYLEILNGKKHFPKLEKIFFGRRAAFIVVGAILVYWVVRNMV